MFAVEKEVNHSIFDPQILTKILSDSRRMLQTSIPDYIPPNVIYLWWIFVIKHLLMYRT